MWVEDQLQPNVAPPSDERAKSAAERSGELFRLRLKNHGHEVRGLQMRIGNCQMTIDQ